MVKVADGTWRVWGLGSGIPAARDVLDDDEFVPGGGTALVFEWLTRIAGPHPPVELIWGSLDTPLRLANTQGWLLGTGKVTDDDPERDELAEELSARESTHPLFDELCQWLVAHYHEAYSTIDGKPCLAGATETVDLELDLELVMFASEEHVGPCNAGQEIPVHTFITRHVGDGKWAIAANARRMPVPVWPPTGQVLPGLFVDGN